MADITEKTEALPVATPSKKAVRYSDEKRKSLLTKYHELRSQGKKTDEASKAIGVSYITIRSWEKGKTKTGKKVKAKKGKSVLAAKKTPKKITGRRGPKAAQTSAGHLTLVTPAGFRIEGISSNELIQVLKALK